MLVVGYNQIHILILNLYWHAGGNEWETSVRLENSKPYFIKKNSKPLETYI